jgi:hypothetical protein
LIYYPRVPFASASIGLTSPGIALLLLISFSSASSTAFYINMSKI